MAEAKSGEEPYTGPFTQVDEWSLATSHRRANSLDGSIRSPFILGHGKSFNWQIWQELKTLESLSATGHTTLAFDIPNNGDNFVKSRSTGPPMDHPDDVYDKLMATYRLRRAVGVFPSQSGPDMAFPILRNRPELLRGIVLVAPIEVAEFAPKLDVPALIVWGSADTIKDPAYADVMAGAFNNVTVATIDGASHAPYTDNPEAFNRLLIEFGDDPSTARDRFQSMNIDGVSFS